MEQMTEAIWIENIQNKVHAIRGQQVMLDYDLAEIYGYEVKRLNEQVKRNIARFPDDFMFQLTAEEDELLKSQIATSSWGGKRKLPYAFTEQDMQVIQKSIDTLNENFVSDKDFKNFVIYKGQKFEADAAYIDIYQQAQKCIYVVDDYVNTKTLQLL